MMPGKTVLKTECLNPNTGGSMKIDADIYDQFSKAILHFLKEKKISTYTEIAGGVKKHFKQKKIAFKGSVGWYTVTVKHDLVARGIIETWMEKGTRLHKLKK
jgi:hypothetical protein